ncbi:MAG TPA: exodeoxyribonuclease VII small subunit [Candidatus Eisenbacteria bacterium]|nr:exodeoxyribonuclease VII small subunit [Candidatus Eisenbacteria bacterium]
MKRKGTPSPPSEAPGDARTFEAMMERLQELVGRLETGNLTLEESIQSFEEGMALVRKCTAVLSQAEQRILKLTRDATGQPVAVPLEEEGEEEGGDELPF